MTTSYEPIMALADGNMAQSEFVSNHVTVDVITLAKENEFFDLLSRAIRRLTKPLPAGAGSIFDILFQVLKYDVFGNGAVGG